MMRKGSDLEVSKLVEVIETSENIGFLYEMSCSLRNGGYPKISEEQRETYASRALDRASEIVLSDR